MISPVLAAIAPLVLLIGLGWLSRRKLVTEDTVWRGIETLAYFVLMPTLLFVTISRAELTGLPWAGLLGALYLTMIIMAGIALLPGLWSRRLERSTRSSLFQGIVRFNIFVSLSLGFALFNPEQAALLGLMAGAVVVAANLLCVPALVGLNSGRLSLVSLATELAKNPLLWACFSGLAFNFAGLDLPEFAWITLERLAATSLPIALLAIGASLSLGHISANVGLNTYSGVLQLLIKPAIAGALALAMGVSPEMALIAVLLLATPTAPSGYILARKLGGDAQAMASMIAFQTIAGFITLLVVLTLWQVIFGVTLAQG